MKGSYQGLNVAEFAQKWGTPQRKAEVAVKHLVDSGLLDGEYVAGTDVPIVMGITAQGRAAFEKYQALAKRRPSSSGPDDTTSPTRQVSTIEPDPRKVFVVHGRNEQLRKDLFSFLRAIGLEPIEWAMAIKLTGKAAPYIGEILDSAFRNAQAIVVLLSPDDEARLRRRFLTSSDPPHEKELAWQARQNVLFEAGMAIAHKPNRTVLIEVGKLRPFSDVYGRHVVKLTNDPSRRQDLTHRLQDAGCEVNLTGSDWLTVGEFSIPEEMPEEKSEPGTDPEELQQGIDIQQVRKIAIDHVKSEHTRAFPVNVSTAELKDGFWHVSGSFEEWNRTHGFSFLINATSGKIHKLEIK